MPKTVQIAETGFDYANLAEPVRRDAHVWAESIHALLGSRQVIGSAEDAVKVGLRLTAVHQLVGGASFGLWLAAEFQWRRPAACKFMRSAHFFKAVDCLANFQPSALYVLSRRGMQSARKAAIAAARSGQLITKSAAEAIVLELAGTSAAIRAALKASRKLSSAVEQIQHNPGPRCRGVIERLLQDQLVTTTALRGLLPPPANAPSVPVNFNEEETAKISPGNFPAATNR